jgi:sugar lactone lactonase YvrE
MCRTRSPATAERFAVALILAIAVAAIAAGCGSSASSTTTTATTSARAAPLVAIGSDLTGPAGLHATVYADGPKTLSTLAFDASGRLWAGASGLSSHNRDGVYLLHPGAGEATEVISGLDDPLGLLWHDERLYVASLGRVDVYSGLHGDRFAHHRRIVDGPVPKGENNNLVLAPDGRLVMGVTASCDHCRLAVLRRSRVVQDRRQRSSGRRTPHPCAGGARLSPGHEHVVRDDEPARRPRRPHAR